jgi:hypothetical protein
MGGGVTVLVADLGLFASGWPSWVRDHPSLLSAALGVGLSLILWGAFFPAKERGEGSLQSVDTGNFAGRDNAGTQIGGSVIGTDALEKILKASRSPTTQSRLHIQSAEYISTENPRKRADVTECLRSLVVDDKLILEIQNHNFVASNGTNYVPIDFHTGTKKKLHVAYSFNNGPLQEVTQLEGTDLIIPQPQAKDTLLGVPNLHFGFSRTMARIVHPSFVFSDSGDECLTVSVQNLPALKGNFAQFLDIVSTLVFTSATGQRTVVSRACWLDHKWSEIRLDVGEMENILIGFPQGETWEAFHNPNDDRRVDTYFKNVQERSVNWYDGASFTVDVQIVSMGAKTRGQTLAHRQFKLTRSGIAYNARWIDET